MLNNPSLLNRSDQHSTLLDEEHCLLIHSTALRAAVQGKHVHALPEHLSIVDLKQREQFMGTDGYLWHPDEIKFIFQGITFSVFETVQTLYCSRLGRSIRMVWQIMCAKAQAQSVPSPSYEAIWALCMYLEEPRCTHLKVSLERGNETWWIGILTPTICIYSKQVAQPYHPTIVCCVHTQTQQLLAFQCTSQELLQEHIPLVLYDAIASQRRPYPRITTGLLWHLPKRILIAHPIPSHSSIVCQQASIFIEQTQETPLFFQEIQEDWRKEDSDRPLPEQQFVRIFDAYLNKRCGSGPLREQKQRDEQFASLSGYQYDPAWQFPLLRLLLPAHSCTITAEGTILYGELHYTHELLIHWSGATVIIRRSASTEATIWVYLDQAILCQAYAQELRRRDGSYRHWR
jgi:hypothetical protein